MPQFILDSVSPNATLDILVENNGRINYGRYLTDNRQGITDKATLNGVELTGWTMYKFPFNSVKNLKYIPVNETLISGWHTLILPADEPAVYAGTFTVTKTGDTWVDMRGFGKGFVFLNGHNLGKYWYIGPQQTLYVPAAWLHKGKNEIEVFDELKANHHQIATLDHPVLNEVVKQ
jgi:beta-galactosidase